MKKKMYVLGLAALVAAMLALSGVAHSAMWVGAEIGGNFPVSTKFNVDSGGISRDMGNHSFHPSVMGGAIIGYDFVNKGFGAYAWPDWMQYFSFATDFTYNRLSANGTISSDGNVLVPFNATLKGYEVVWTFLFMAHYGFLRDSEVPSGRINPYIGVGPGILWSGFDKPNGRGSANSMDIALVVEPGIRWMALPNVSIDTAMRYRYAAPSWGFGNNVTLKTDALHQLAFLLRANYHF